MFKKAAFQNFQCWKKYAVTFGKITVFVGESDLGKSALIRGLRWLCLNQPLGDDFIGDWKNAPFACVKLSLDQNTIISRKRGKKCGNYYQINKNKPLRAFKNGVPDTVYEKLNVSDVNFQTQLDAPYWFLESPVEVSRRLNAIINLEAIDRTLENAARKVRDAKSDVKHSVERLRDAKESHAELEWVVEAGEKLQRLESLQKRIVKLEKRIDLATECRKIVSAEAEKLKHYDTLLSARQRVAQTGAKALALKRRLDKLKALRAQLADLTRQQRPLPSITELTQSYEKVKQLKDRIRRLSALSLEYRQHDYEVKQADVMIDAAHKELEKLTKGRCPVCKRKLPT